MQLIPTRARLDAARPWRAAAATVGTIRGRILIAFLAMSLITGALGLYAMVGIQASGTLVTRTFDGSLMAINHARAAAADFAKIRAAFTQAWIMGDPRQMRRVEAEVAELKQSLTENLGIAAERAQSVRVNHAAVKVQEAVLAWGDLADKLRRGAAEADWSALDRQATMADGQIDLLVNYTAGDGFIYRQKARAAVAENTQVIVAATCGALLLAALVTWLLARRIIGPVAAASGVAERIAAGDLTVEVPRGGRDELGTLLGAMTSMRDNIRAMMEREVSQRRSAQTRLADALETSSEGVIVVDATGHLVLANAQAEDFFGAAVTQAGMPVRRLAERTTEPGRTVAVLSSPEATAPDAEICLTDGRWLRVSRSETREGGYVAVCSNISLLKQQEAILTATNLRLDAALDNMSQGLCLFDSRDRLMVVNRRYGEIYRLPPGTIRPGLSSREVMLRSVSAGNHPGLGVEDLVVERDRLAGADERSPYFQELGDGRVIQIDQRPTADGGFVATYEDVTERWHAEARIAHMARHDSLTDLPNRVMLGERIEGAITQAGRESGFGVFCLDLDNFKQINDTLGHSVGDELLKAVAHRLQACIRETDTVARLGGDEFAIVQAGVERPEDAAVLAARIIEVVSAPYALTDHSVTVGVSIGVAIAPSDGMAPEKLLKNADVALYRAKGDGRGLCRFFESEMDARLQARRQLEIDLRAALEAENFELYYQPIYDLACDRICGFEALLRWNHPERGRISPADFIPLAEEIGLIVPLGEWVLRRACAEASQWPDDLKIAVNVSPAQFVSARLIGAVRSALSESGLSPRRLELEITESVLLTNGTATLAILHTLRGLGARISMDDFGTGYSSLSYLRSFPFDKMKIDQSFIRDLTIENGSGFIVRTVISLSASLGMTTTAEGVETEAQLARLREEGCDEVQGYLFSPPVPAACVPELLQKWNGPARAVA